MVRKHILAFLVIFSPIFSVIAEDILLVQLNNKAVEKHVDQIARELWRNAWYKRLSVVAGVCAAAYGSYYFFLKKPTMSAATAALTAVNAASAQGQSSVPQETVKNEVTNEELKQLISEQKIDQSTMKLIADFILEQRKKADTGFTGTLKTWGATTLNFVIRESAVAVVFSAVIGAFGKYFRSMDNALDSVLYKVFHPGNLQWYIATHTNIYTLLNDLEWHAYCIEQKRLPKKASPEGAVQSAVEVMLSEEQVAYHIKSFATTWSMCAQEFESILGFMWVKAQQVGASKTDTSNQEQADNQESSSMLQAKRFTQITEHVYKLADTFRLEAEELLRKDVTMRTGLVQAVTRLRLLFMEERSAFTSCEKA